MLFLFLALARTLHLGSGLLLAGCLSFSWLRPNSETVLTEQKGWLKFLWWTQVFSGGLWFLLVTWQFLGLTLRPADLIMIATQTHFGRLWSFRAGVALILGYWLFLRRGESLSKCSELFRWSLTLVLLLSLAWSGHAASQIGNKFFQISTDVLHLFAASLWPAGLFPLLLFLIDKKKLTPDDLELIRRFSKVSLIAVALLALSGFSNYLFFIGTWKNLFVSTYGLLLCGKICLFFLMLSLGGYYRFFLLARLATHANTLNLFRCALLLENGFAALILILTAFLGLSSPPRCPFCP